MDVVGLGQISLDRVVRVAAWPERGGREALADAPIARPGGQVATAVLAAHRLGCSARLLGCVGDDDAGAVALAPLREAGVDLDGVQEIPGVPTRTALILVDARDGERSVLGHCSPSLRVDTTKLSRDAVRGAGVVLVDADDPDAARWVATVARESGLPTVLDVDRADAARLELARTVDFPIVSEAFSRELSGDGCEDETLARLASGSVRMAVVTRGARGAVARLDGERLTRPAFAVAARDTTGAGDVFRGAFAWGLRRGGAAAQVLAGAAAAAALASRGEGAQGALPSAEEVAKLVQTAPG